jgi:hypothetical protein
MRRVAAAATRAGAASTARRQRSADKAAKAGGGVDLPVLRDVAPTLDSLGISVALPKLVAVELRRNEDESPEPQP